METVRRIARTTLGTLLGAALALLAACGGGDAPPVATPVPAQAGAADIGPAGGSVSAVFEGGATVTLTVPAGALATVQTLRIDPSTAPADALAAMTLSPAGLQFRTAATLTVVLPGGTSGSDTLVAFGIGNTTVPIGAFDPATRTMTVDLLYLGVGAAAPTAAGAGGGARTAALAAHPAAAATNPTIELLVRRGDLAGAATLWHQSVVTLAAAGSRDNAVIVQEGFAALVTLPFGGASQALKDQIASDVTTWRNIDCAQLATAIHAVDAFDFSADYAGYTQRAIDVLVWGRLMQDLKPLTDQLGFISVLACAAVRNDASEPLRSSFPHYIDAAKNTLAGLDPLADFALLLNTRVPQLLAFDAALRSFGGVDDFAAQVATIASGQTTRLRQAAYDDCRLHRSQEKQHSLLVKEVSDPGFDATSPYEQDDLHADIELCGMVIGWQLRDAQGQVLASGTAGGGTSAGAATPTASLPMASADKLVLSGPLSALRCPSGAGNNEQLAFAAGPLGGATTALPSLTPANDDSYLAVSSVDLSVAQLKALAQPSGPGDGALDIARSGAVCNGEFSNLSQHRRLVRFELDFVDVQIDTTALAGGRVGAAYSQTLAASGGTAPYAWSAAGLPAGLALDAASGVIAGTPTAAGNASVIVTVRSADGGVGLRTLALTIDSGTLVYTGTISDKVDQVGFTNCGGTVCFTLDSFQHDTYDVRLELQPDGSFVATGTITSTRRDKTTRADGCDSLFVADGTGRVTTYTGKMPSRPVGFISGTVNFAQTNSGPACPSHPAFSLSSNVTGPMFVNTNVVTPVVVNGVLQSLTWDWHSSDPPTNTTFSTTGTLTLAR